ncbi:MAG: hypothetical protein AAGU27_10885 [Dehalobacterium sp.]
MNTRIGGKAFGNYVQRIEVIEETGNIRYIERQDLCFNYRLAVCRIKRIRVRQKFNIDLETEVHIVGEAG